MVSLSQVAQSESERRSRILVLLGAADAADAARVGGSAVKVDCIVDGVSPFRVMSEFKKHLASSCRKICKVRENYFLGVPWKAFSD